MLATPPAAAQQLPAAPPFTAAMAHRIDALAEGELRAHSTPGLAIGVIEDGLLVYSRGFGEANLARRIPVRAQTQFYVGGLARTFTAASILLLAQAKRLSLTDRVTRFVPELTIAKNVTVAQLLQQTSGLPDYRDAPGISKDPNRPIKMPALLAAVDKMTPLSPPGQRFSENGFNYMVAGLIVARAGGLPLSLYEQTHIFQPLMMTSTFSAGDQGIMRNHALGYTRVGRRFVQTRTWDASWLYGAADLVTNVDDLAKWDIGMPLLLNVDSVREMWSPGAQSSSVGHAMGWTVDERGGHRLLWQNGQIAGYHAMNALLPGQHVGVVVLANVDALHNRSTVSPERLAYHILDVVDPLPPAHFANAVMNRAKEWLARIAAVDIDRTQLTPAFSKYLNLEIVEKTDLKAYGPVVSMLPIESYERKADTVYVFDVRFRHGTERYEFTLTPDGKIDGITFSP